MQKTIDELNEAGYKFSCFLADSIFSSDGIYPDPVGFLKATVDVVHKNGGVFIADEVQPGFARTGQAFFGFARHGIVPDMITMEFQSQDLLQRRMYLQPSATSFLTLIHLVVILYQ